MRRLWLPILIALGIPALAQNPQCPTRALGDKTNACASTAFVSNAITAFPIGTNYWTLTGTDIYNANTGNVGVGTSTPAFDGNAVRYFTVGNATAHKWSEIGIGGNASTIGDLTGILGFYNSSLGATEKRVASIASITDGATNSGNLGFFTANAGTFGERMHITAGGRIGMGTATPAGQIDIVSNSASLPSIELSVPDQTKAPGIEWAKLGAVGYNWSIPQNSATYSNKFVLSNSSAGYPGTSLLGVDTAGNVALLAAQYLNFGTTFGSGGYGLHSNSGAMQYKNSGGSWVNICQPGNICGVDYGVNCDGSTSMNTPLTNAINAVNTANATSPIGLYLPPGVCMVTPGSLPVLTASLYGPDTVFKSNSNISGCLLTAEFLTKALSVTNDVYVTNFDFGGFVSSQTAAPGNEDGLCVTGAIHAFIFVRKAIVLNHGVAIDISVTPNQFTENRVTVKADANNVNLYLKTSAAGGFFSIDANYFDLLTSYQPVTNGVIVQMDADNTHGVTSNQFKFDDMEIGGINSFGVVAHGFTAGNTFTAYTQRGKNGSGKYYSFDALACQNTVFAPTNSTWVGGDNTNFCAGVPATNFIILGNTPMP